MKAANLTILTFNTLGIPFLTTHRHKNYFSLSRNLLARFTYFTKELNEADADIIMLQEVHLYSLLRYMKKKLSNYPYVSYKRFIYGPKGGLVIFSKHEFIERPYFNYTLRGSFKNKTFINRIIRNGAVIIDLKELPITVINTYISGDFSHTWGGENKYTKYQRSQLDELLKEITALRAQGRSIILGGDLNINSHTSLYTELLSKGAMTDPFSKEVTYTQHPDFLPKGVKAPRLSHIFYNEKAIPLTVSKTNELFTQKVQLENGKESYLSDHKALKVTFTLN